jgi:ABC-type sugar transport system permease subunit
MWIIFFKTTFTFLSSITLPVSNPNPTFHSNNYKIQQTLYKKKIGQHTTLFTTYKFRTMKDGRAARIGSFIRKTKLDELTQLFNILKRVYDF